MKKLKYREIDERKWCRIGTLPTFRSVIERFDLIYPNDIPFSDKLRFLFGFERSLFLSKYLMEKPDVTIETFAESEPLAGFQHEDLYIKALLVKFYITKNDTENAGRAVALLSEATNKIQNKIEHQLFDDISDGG